MTSPQDKNFFKFNTSVGRSTFTNSREVVGRHKLAPGHYVIVPSTFKPNESGDFLLRIFSEQQAPTEYGISTRNGINYNVGLRCLSSDVTGMEQTFSSFR